MFKRFVAALATIALTAGLSTVAIASASADDPEGAVALEMTSSEQRVADEESEGEKADKEKADKEKADKEKADKEKADKEKADKEKVEPIVDEDIKIVLTYMTGCAPDATNTWRVRNPGNVTVIVNYNGGGVHKAEPGDTVIETKRDTKETMIISWGKDGSGIKPGRAVKAAGTDLPNTDPSCTKIAPNATIAVTQCVYNADGKAAFREVRITFDNSQSNVPVDFVVPWFSSFNKTVAAGATYTFRAANMWPTGGGYSVVAGGQTFNLPIARCAEPVKPAAEVTTTIVPVNFSCDTWLVTVETTTTTTPYVFDSSNVRWVKGTPSTVTVSTTRPFTNSEVAERCPIIAPNASIAATECVYDADGKAAFREVRITFDNSQSNVPVDFVVPWFSSFNKTVAAGEIYTFRAANMWPAGGGYSVVAGGQTFDLPIARCAEPVKPADEVATTIVPVDFSCDTQLLTIETTTTTTPYVFDSSNVRWVKGTPSAATVSSTRAFTNAEMAEHCTTALVEAPRASSCDVQDADTTYTRWIRLAIDPTLKYSITNTATSLVTIPTREYTELPVGGYLVAVVAADGYVLDGDPTSSWSLVVEDSGFCSPVELPTPVPTDPSPGAPTEPAGTLPTTSRGFETSNALTDEAGAAQSENSAAAASAREDLPTLATGGDANQLNPAAGSGLERFVNGQNRTLTDFRLVVIAALTLMLICALFLLLRRYLATREQ